MAGRGVGTRRAKPLEVQRRHLTMTAACATLLGALPLGTVFEQWTWLLEAALAVGALCAVGVLLRATRIPAWLPSLAMLAVFPVVLALLFPATGGGGWLASAVPSPAMIRHFNELLVTAGIDMRRLSAPVPDRLSLLFLSTLGIGTIAILVDIFAVVLKRPALAGLPMLAMYSVPVAIERHSVNLVLFALGALGFLWLLVIDSIDRVRRFGRRFSGDGRDVDLWAPSPLAAAGQRLGLVGVVLAVAVPIVLPGMGDGLLERARDAGGFGGLSGAGSGGSVQLSAMLSGNLRRDKIFPMVKVRTNDPNPYYLRFAMADRLTPHGFTDRKITGGVTATTGTLPAPPPSLRDAGNQTYQANVEIVQLDSSFLPTYQHLASITGIGKSWRYDANSTTVYSDSDNSRNKKYTFQYVRPEYVGDQLRNAPPVDTSADALRDSLYVPKVPAVAKLVSDLAGQEASQYDAVMAILKYFSPENGFSYALSTKESTGEDELVSFLANKQGYCVQYSAAMAWLVRQAKYPARVAFGFTRGTTANGVSTLTNVNLHAWTEVYFEGFGWVPFDPTPATGVNGSVSPAWAPNPSRPNEPAQPTPGASSSPGAPQAAASPPQGTNQKDGTGPGTSSGESSRSIPIWSLGVASGLIGLLLVCSLPAWRRRALRQRRLSQRRAGVRDRAHAAWDELLDTMADYELPIDPAESPRATAARLARIARLTGPAATAAKALGQAEELARYARQPAGETPADLAAALATTRAAIHDHAARRVRIRATLLPASVIGSWRSALERLAGRSTTAVVTGGEAVARSVGSQRLRARRLFR